jgi:chitinase
MSSLTVYNQGIYTTCTSLLTSSGGNFPGTSLFEIAALGVPLNKLVIGKPTLTSEASDGYVAPSTLAGCVSQAKGKGWNGMRLDPYFNIFGSDILNSIGGLMTWEWNDASHSADSSWVSTVWESGTSGGSGSPPSGGGGPSGPNYAGELYRSDEGRMIADEMSK